MEKGLIKKRILGSLIGGAIGDALGYAVEFLHHDEIYQTYGSKGITRFDLRNGIAQISDDTQMTMFTANGMLRGSAERASGKAFEGYEKHIVKAYLEWLQTQYMNMEIPNEHTCWIRDIEELQYHRAPGNTCLSALNEIAHNREVKNDSKGCGGIMRVAPIGLYAAASTQYLSHEEAIELGAKAARITHKHPLGWISAALMTHIIYEQTLEEHPSREQFYQCIMNGKGILTKLFPEQLNYIEEQYNLVELAIRFAENSHPDVETIEQIGGGWVGEETLAIAIYCCYKYFDNFEKAIIASVNNSGDSDSIGAVTGNIMGTILGYDAIPHYYVDDLEFSDTLTTLATDLAEGECPLSQKECPDEKRRRWTELYLNTIV